jgi:hypothetical protein
VLAIAGFVALALSQRPEAVSGPRPTAERPPLMLLTSLPLLFGETFGLENSGSPALTRIKQRYKVLPIGVADGASLDGRKLLLMAHPRAQPAMALVELDQWVRDGGRLLLLADPRLDWPSQRPLGDLLRPPPMFADTGLLNHWGLTLQAEEGSSVGRLQSKGTCTVTKNGFIGHCRIGKGRVTVVADADFINVETAESGDLDPLIIELGRLEAR